jgi:hypothetical protein
MTESFVIDFVRRVAVSEDCKSGNVAQPEEAEIKSGLVTTE